MASQEMTVRGGARHSVQAFTIENAQLIFKNFSGRVSEYNEKGLRDTGVLLDDLDIAAQMKQDGWNVKYLKPREEGDVPRPWLPVAVSYKNRPPRVVVIARRFNPRSQEFEQVRTGLPEDMVDMLDYADIASVDIAINPYSWGPNAMGASGVKAYLKSIYVTIRMDALEEKYAAIPEVDVNGGLIQIEGPPGDDLDTYDENAESEVIEGEFMEEED